MLLTASACNILEEKYFQKSLDILKFCDIMFTSSQPNLKDNDMLILTAHFPGFSKKGRNYPIYLTQLLNIACQNSQATRASNIGSVKETFCEWIQSVNDVSLESWKNFFLHKNGNAVLEVAAKKMYVMVTKMIGSACNHFEESSNLEKLIAEWIEEIVFEKSYQGMLAEMIAAKTLADYTHLPFKLSDSKGEKDGVDIILGDKLIQIKKQKGGYSPSLFFNKVKENCILVTYDIRGDEIDIFIREDEGEVENR
jgi:hypothetical protein